MLRLLKIEWNKIYYYKTARIFTILYFVLLSIIGSSFYIIFSFILKDKLGFSVDLSQTGFFNFPVIWQNMTYLLVFGKIFLAVIIITNITNEYSNKTLKQNLIDGLSKKEFLHSKLFTSFLLAIISAIFVLIICLVLGLINSSTENQFYEGMEYVGAYGLNLIFFFTFCSFVAFLTRKSAFALLLVFIWWVSEWVLILTEVYIKKEVMHDLVTEKSFILMQYLPLSSASSMLNFSNVNFSGFMNGGTIFTFSGIEWKFVIAVIFYIILFTFLSYRLLKKRDL